MREIYIGEKSEGKIMIKTKNPGIKSRILSYRGKPGVRIISKKGDSVFAAEIPISFIRVIAPIKPWENIKGCLSEDLRGEYNGTDR